MNVIANISSGASLPASYENAKTALANCAKIDECQTWADKAAALASYAKQAEDTELEKMAVRIRARAIRRAGELLKQIEPGKTGPKPELSVDAHTQLNRQDAAEDAGMSKHQMVQAIRVANVPEPDFTAMVEADKPATVTAIAEAGKKPAPRPQVVIDHTGGRDPKIFNRCLHFVGDIEAAANQFADFRIDELIPHLTISERARVKKAVSLIDAVNDQIMTRV